MADETERYIVVPLTEALFEQAAALLAVMWGISPDESRLRLRWKYVECPLATKPLVYLALHGADVVATLAFFPSPFRLGDRRVLVLCPGDGFVHPDHRRYGLYTRLLMAGHTSLSADFDFFISVSANPVSAAGLLKIGWRAVAPHSGLSRLQIAPAIRYLLNAQTMKPWGNAVVVEPASIARLYDELPVVRDTEQGQCLPDPDHRYIEWRYSNPTKHYVAIPYSQDGRLAAFAVCMATERDLFVLDYRERPGAQGLRNVVRSMREAVRAPRYNWYGNVLSVSQRRILRSLGFRDYRPLLNIFLDRPSVPVLIHPTKKDCGPSDWIVDGVDLGRHESWVLPEFCNDGY